ncbi:MAG: tetratricopeptide repeat protein [Planctomycetota bacterium]
MPIFYCPSCGKRANVPESSIGKRGKCKCGADVVVPAHDEPPPFSETQADEPPPLPATADEPPPLPTGDEGIGRVSQSNGTQSRRPMIVGVLIVVVCIAAYVFISLLNLGHDSVLVKKKQDRARALSIAESDPDSSKESIDAEMQYYDLMQRPGMTPQRAMRMVAAQAGNPGLVNYLRGKHPEAIAQADADNQAGQHTSSFKMNGTPLKKPDARQPIVAPERSPSAPTPPEKHNTATIAPTVSVDEIEKSFPKVQLKPIIAPPAVSAQDDEKLKQQLIEKRAAYAAGKLAGIKLPPEVVIAPGFKTQVAAIEVRGEDVEAIRTKLDAQDWIGALQIVSRNMANGVPSEGDIDYAVTNLLRKRMMVLVKGDMAVSEMNKPGPVWITCSRSGNSFSLRKSREFEKHPDGIGLLHSWRIDDGQPLIAYGVYRDVQRSLEGIEQTFRDKAKVWADKKRLGEVDAVEAQRQTDALFADTMVEIRKFVMNYTIVAESATKAVEPKALPKIVSKPIAPKQSAKALMNMANQYRNTGDLTKAKEYANRVIEQYPDAPEADDAKSLLQIQP